MKVKDKGEGSGLQNCHRSSLENLSGVARKLTQGGFSFEMIPIHCKQTLSQTSGRYLIVVLAKTQGQEEEVVLTRENRGGSA